MPKPTPDEWLAEKFEEVFRRGNTSKVVPLHVCEKCDCIYTIGHKECPACGKPYTKEDIKEDWRMLRDAQTHNQTIHNRNAEGPTATTDPNSPPTKGEG